MAHEEEDINEVFKRILAEPKLAQLRKKQPAALAKANREVQLWEEEQQNDFSHEFYMTTHYSKKAIQHSHYDLRAKINNAKDAVEERALRNVLSVNNDPKPIGALLEYC